MTDQSAPDPTPEIAPEVTPEVTPETGPAPPEPRPALDTAALDQLFRAARSDHVWSPSPVADETLTALYDLLKFGPTSANCSPARFLFLKSQLSRQALLPALSPGNVDRVITAPVVCVVAHDPQFYDRLPQLYPRADARPWFAANPEFATETAFRNGTLQGAYLLLAARALGLDCSPMSGFDSATLDRTLMADYGWRANFLIALGHAAETARPPRDRRLTFADACRIL